MTSLLERLRTRRQPAPIPPPEPPLDSQAALRFLDLVSAFADAKSAHEAAVGRLSAARCELANAEGRRAAAPRVERDGLYSLEVSNYGWTDGKGTVKRTARELDLARAELVEAEESEASARMKLDEALTALVASLGAAEHAKRFLAMQNNLAGQAVAAAQAAFTPAVAAKMHARRQHRHPRHLEDLPHALDGVKLAEADRAVDAADAALKSARHRAREAVTARERLERAVEAALEFESRPKRR